MKNSKAIFKFLIVFLLIAQNSFAISKPIPGVGIVVKKNPGSGNIKVSTGNDGSFSSQLEAGEYEISFSQDQLRSVINSIVKKDFPKSSYQYDGSGVELTLDNSSIRVNLKPIRKNNYSITDQSNTFVIMVPEAGTTFSGVLSWDDAVLTKSDVESELDKTDAKAKNYPYFKSNNASGEMLAMNRSVKENPLYEQKNGEVNPLFGAQGKGIRENGLKKNDIENVSNDADVKSIAETLVNRKSNINGINNNGMPNRISMNVTVPKQTQGATFGEKVNSGKINITLVENGCVVLFPSNEGYRISLSDTSINELSTSECSSYSERVNQGIHNAGGALAQGASLLGGALPGGTIISAAISSVGNLAGGAGGGAASASYAATGKITKADSGKTVIKIQDDESDAILELVDGEYAFKFVIAQKSTSGLKDTLKTQVRIGFSVESGIIKTKHDTVKNSINNVR